MNKTKLAKYTLGTLAILSCWAIGTHEIKRPNAAPKPENALPQREIRPAPAIQQLAPARKIEPLPLPERASEAEIIGLEFALFEPLPYIAKKSAKRRK